MKKFKVKNRQKRRYTRKQKNATQFSLARTTLIGLLPFMAIAVAFTTITVLNTRPTYTSFSFTPSFSLTLPQISLPTIAFPTITNPFESLPVVTIPQIPVISVSITPVSLPSFHISFTPLLQFFGALQTMIHTFLLQLNPLPFITSVGKELLALEQYIFQVTGTSFTKLITNSLYLESFLLKNLLTMVENMLQHLLTAGQILVQALIISALFIQNILLLCTKTIHTWLTMLVRTIQTPFLVLGDYYNQLRPYLDYLGIHIKQSLITMSGGVNDINTLASEFIKSNTNN